MELTQSEVSWAVTEFSEAQLNDPRRTQRLIEIAALVSAQPTASWPQICGDKAMLKATYRFFDNDAIDPKSILESHIDATNSRIADSPTVVAIQDTTQLSWTHHPKTQDLGPLSGKNQQGLLAHTTLATTVDRVPLGIIDQQVWARDPKRVGKKAKRKTTPIDQKESQKWLTGLLATIDMSVQHPDTHFVSVCDREADVYDLFIVDRPANVDLLIRAAWNRRVSHPEKYLWERVMAQPTATMVALTIPPRHGQPGREAQLAVRFCSVCLCPPKHRPKEKLPNVTVWAVSAIETSPPEKTEPVEWLLLSTKAVDCVSDAIRRLDWYSCRWTIETFHKVLKSGCRIEERHLQTKDRLLRCLAVLSPTAWWIVYATMLCRTQPHAPASAILSTSEWQALYCRIHQTSMPPQQPPELAEAVGWIAKLGGFIGRKGDGQPGVTVMWRGFMHLAQIVAMYHIFQPPPLE